jgi:hypothetical protein
MPARLIYGPVLNELSPDGRITRRPKVAAMLDSGATDREYGHVSAISDGASVRSHFESGTPLDPIDTWCVSLVVGSNLSALDADAELINILEEAGGTVSGIRTMLTSSPNQLGWSTAKRNRVQNRLTAKGASLTGLTANSPLWQFLNRLCQVVMPTCDIREWRAAIRGHDVA